MKSAVSHIFYSLHKLLNAKLSFYSILVCLMLVSGCAQRLDNKPIVTVNERTQFLNTVTYWQVKGKIAFIQKNKRERANLYWQKTVDKQSLRLSTYLGIGVLSLETANQIHTLEVDGNTYHTDDLDQLIWQLTGLTFPSDALAHWMKALPYSDNDNMINHPVTNLPQRLTSFYGGRVWQVSYNNYQVFAGVTMPTSITINQNGLTIKLVINDWAF